jgi:hypothetical protein
MPDHLSINRRGQLSRSLERERKRTLGINSGSKTPPASATTCDNCVSINIVNGAWLVSLHPGYVSDEATIRLMEWFEDCATWPITMAHYCDTAMKWLSQRIENKTLAQSRAAALILKAYEQTYARVLEGPDLSSSLNEKHPYSRVLSLWSQMSSCDGEKFLEVAPTELLGERYWLTRYDSKNDRMIVHDVGTNMPSFAKLELLGMRGRAVEDLPDIWLGRALARAYLAVCISDKPIVQAVDAVVDWPGKTKEHVRYLRTALPVRAFDQHWVLSAHLLDPSINLRLPAKSQTL